jgi:signal transduction histidine kinase
MREVLVVDDVAKNIEVVSEILYERGIEVSFALSGEEALSSLDHHLPDLILLDIAMPGMDGFELCRRIKENETTREIPVIFLTAKNDTADLVRGFELGGVDYITKPFHTAELLSRVQTQLELKRQRDMIARQNNELKELNEQKNRFFSIIAHDLKNPFTGFLGLTELMDKYYESLSEKELRDYISNLSDTSQRLYRLLENLLTWSRLQLNNISAHPLSFLLAPLFRETVELFEKTAREKKATLLRECPEDLQVYADRDMTASILRNLVSNGIKYIDQGGRVEINAVSAPGHGGEVEIRVTDTGIGMSEDTLTNLFSLKKRPVRPGTRGESGTGLGLLLTREFVLLNKGRIEASGKPGEGSVFRVCLPAAPPADLPAVPPAEAASSDASPE